MSDPTPPETVDQVLADVAELRWRRSGPLHRPGSPEDCRQQGEVNALNAVLHIIEGTFDWSEA